jgi:hypothetical protein
MKFPGPAPGPARSSATNGLFTLENNLLALSWMATNGQMLPAAFVSCSIDKFTDQGQSWATETTGNLFFVGDVNDVAVYGYALTAAQVNQHYQAQNS